MNHQDGKKRLVKKEAHELDIAKQLANYNDQNHLIGEHLPQETQVLKKALIALQTGDMLLI